jgi:membrane-bound metal-dependent hydrolase YbcI (DUF457 family)
MMGRAHALSGMAAFAAAAPAAAAATGWFALTPATWAVGSLMCAGAALAPDLDHPGSSSASNALKPVTTMLSTVVAAVSFGHRKGTHSLLGIAAATLGMLLLTNAASPWGPLLVSFFLAAFAVKALRVARLLPAGPVRRVSAWALSAAAAATVSAVSGGDFAYLLFAVGLGTLVHVVGDCITIGGVPWFWPLSQRNIRIAALSAGGPTELYILTPLFAAAIAWLALSGILHGTALGHPIDTGTAAASASEGRAKPTGKPAAARKGSAPRPSKDAAPQASR